MPGFFFQMNFFQVSAGASRFSREIKVVARKPFLAAPGRSGHFVLISGRTRVKPA